VRKQIGICDEKINQTGAGGVTVVGIEVENKA